MRLSEWIEWAIRGTSEPLRRDQNGCWLGCLECGAGTWEDDVVHKESCTWRRMTAAGPAQLAKAVKMEALADARRRAQNETDQEAYLAEARHEIRKRKQ